MSFEVRACIKGCVALNTPSSQIYRELYEIPGTSTISQQSPNNQLLHGPKKLEMAKFDVKDVSKYGQFKGAAAKADIAPVEHMVKQDAKCTVKEIAKRVSISSASLHKI